MSRRDWEDDEQVIIVQENDSALSTFLLGAAIGAGLALIFAPQTGAETRQTIRRGARRAGDATRRAGDRLTDAFAQAKVDIETRIDSAKSSIETRIDSAKSSIDLKKVQVSRAVDAGREAAKVAREDLERRMADQRAADAAEQAGDQGNGIG